MVAELTAEIQNTAPPRVQLTVTGIGQDTPLLTNGGFEAGTTGWTAGDGVTLTAGPSETTPTDAPAPVAGNWFGYATTTLAADAGEALLFSQTVTVPVGAIIAATGSLAGTTSVPVTLRLTATTAGTPDTTTRTEATTNLDTAWQDLTPTDLQLDTAHDGVLLEVIASPISGEIARNLFPDPATKGTGTGWATPNPPTIDTTRGHNDLRSLHFAAAPSTSWTLTAPDDATQITISAWYQAPAGTTYQIRVGGTAVNSLDSSVFTASGDWEQRMLTVDVTTPGAEFWFNPARSASDEIWVDDIGVTPGESPVDFNGDTPDEGIYTYDWADTPYASDSVKSIVDPVPVEVYADEFATIVPGSQGALTIYRVVGSTYTPVRGLSNLQPTTSTVVGYDQAAPFGVEVFYTMEFVRDDGTVTEDTAGPLVLTSDSSWLSHPITGQGLPVTIVTWTEWVYAARQSIVQVSGRAAPVVVSDKRLRPTSELELFTATREDLMTLRELLATGDILQMRPVCDAVEPDFLAIGDVTETRYVEAGPGTGSDWRRITTLACQAVDQPAPAIPAIGDTLENLANYVPGTLADFPSTFGEDGTLLTIATTPLTVE